MLARRTVAATDVPTFRTLAEGETTKLSVVPGILYTHPHLASKLG